MQQRVSIAVDVIHINTPQIKGFLDRLRAFCQSRVQTCVPLASTSAMTSKSRHPSNSRAGVLGSTRTAARGSAAARPHARTPPAACTKAQHDLRLAHFRRKPELLPIVALGDIRKQLAGRRHARRAARLRYSRAMPDWRRRRLFQCLSLSRQGDPAETRAGRKRSSTPPLGRGGQDELGRALG